jgi:L-2-hydroxyglutarate oxidase LhgO
MTTTTDFLVIGAGIIGLSIAREIRRQYTAASVTVLEKEPQPGFHSSGRNSGVLHSGLYYTPGSLKAQLCRQGAREMAEFHTAHGLRLNRLGKILTPTAPEYAASMATIAERARQNGVRVEKLDAQALHALEPETRSATGEALWVPDTAVGSPGEVLRVLAAEAQAQGITLRCNAELAQVDTANRTALLHNGETISFGYTVNAAGLHSDRVAHMFGTGARYSLLPFKGLYWKLNPDANIRINHLIYPVPDLRILYLGVHTTTGTDGTVYFGPTAVPALGRENYRGLEAIDPLELPRIFRNLGKMFIRDQDGFRSQAWQEGRRFFKPWFTQAAQSLLPRLQAGHLLPAAKVGIHPRIFDRQSGALLKDFLVEHSENALHILGATSPAWTSAFPFARHIFSQFIDSNPSSRHSPASIPDPADTASETP